MSRAQRLVNPSVLRQYPRPGVFHVNLNHYPTWWICGGLADGAVVVSTALTEALGLRLCRQCELRLVRHEEDSAA